MKYETTGRGAREADNNGFYKTSKNLSINPKMIINIEVFTLIEDIENGNIYHNPIVVIRYKDNNKVVIHFENDDEALGYFQKLTDKLNFFNLSLD